MIDLKNKISEELSTFSKQDAESYCTNPENYNQEFRKYPILSHWNDGIRNVFVPKDFAKNKDVQYARTVPDVSSFEEIDAIFSRFEEIGHNDISRIWEIENFFSVFAPLEEHLNKGDAPTLFPKKFCEIGFRHLKLMKYYEEKYDIPVLGYDICDISVKYANHKNYEAKFFDLNYISAENNLDLAGYNLVACYHVLEHVVDPLKALSGIYESMDDLTVFHVEVPLEDTPNVKYGHVFPFHTSDLPIMMQTVGFSIVGQGTHNCPGYGYERVIAVKNYEKYDSYYKELRTK